MKTDMGEGVKQSSFSTERLTPYSGKTALSDVSVLEAEWRNNFILERADAVRPHCTPKELKHLPDKKPQTSEY